MRKAERPYRDQPNNEQDREHKCLNAHRSADKEARDPHQGSGKGVQHDNRCALAHPKTHQPMMDMPQIGFADRVMLMLSPHNGRQRIQHGNACDDKGNQHHDEALRANHAGDGDNAEDQPQ